MIAIVDYGAGNLTSVRLAFEALGAACEVTSDPGRILSAGRVVFPGVGSAGAAMENLAGLGLADALREAHSRRIPILGICLGAQVVLERSDEDGGVECLGLLPGRVARFEPGSPPVKIPHMGWNAVEPERAHPVLEGVPSGAEFYFVHSYHAVPADDADVVARTGYSGVRFASIIGRANLVACQFHPERSGRMGMRVLASFARWDGGV